MGSQLERIDQKKQTMRHCEYYFNNMPSAAVESTTTARTLILELVRFPPCSPNTSSLLEYRTLKCLWV